MRIIFLLSMPRSGSTVLRLHLNQFEGTLALPETHFFVFHGRHRQLDPNSPVDREELADRWVRFHRIRKMPFDKEALRKHIVADARSWKDILLFTLEAYRQDQAPELADPLWVEKSPPHIFHQPAIREMFPEARFIYLLRDPRAVIGSLKTMPWSTTNVYALARSWNKALALSNIKEGSIFVRYEDLVREPEPTFNKLGEFLGARGTYQAPTRLTDAVEENNAFSRNAFKPLSTEMIDKWRNQLSTLDSDLSIIQHLCGTGMQRMGYELADTGRDTNFRINLLGQQLRFLLLRTLGRTGGE
jgi:hypothetical protein